MKIEKVLLIEDDPAHAYLIAIPVEHLDKKIRTIGKISDLKDYDLKWCDLILLDLHLPDSSGIETLKTVVGRTDKPIIVISSSDEREVSREEIRKLGAIAYLPKDKLLPEIMYMIRDLEKKH